MKTWNCKEDGKISRDSAVRRRRGRKMWLTTLRYYLIRISAYSSRFFSRKVAHIIRHLGTTLKIPDIMNFYKQKNIYLEIL